jgi:hypothetical protein
VTVRLLDATRDALIALQGQLIAMLAGQNAALAGRLARLERAASRNSGNSSFPPSMDDQPGRTPPPGKPAPGKRAGKRNQGKQPGAPGSHLAWSQNPDQTVPHYPRGACACGADLAGAADLGAAASHQEVEIPQMTAKVIQHDLHEVACGCGRLHRAQAPPGTGIAGTVTYGISLQAWCVYLMAAHAIPVHRCAELIETLTGARPSPGFVHGMLARAATALLRELLIQLMLEDVAVEDRGGALHLNGLITEARLQALRDLPPIAATREAVIAGHLACTQLFLPIARELSARAGVEWPAELERAAREHLRRSLSLEFA